MEDEGGVLLDGKALGNLRVVDLKQELEKRGLSKSGSKKDLVKRLKQQLEFEKLCGERKSTGDCDLKLELDADTEQNEFVQQYLAQQQKIYAEQKEVKRLIELEEVQKSGDERGSDSPKAEDASDHDTRDASDNESPPEVFENVQATSSIQGKTKIDDVDSSKLDEDDSRQKEIKKKDNDSEQIASPSKGGNIKQTTEAENPLSKIKDEEMSAQSDSNEENAITNVSKIEVVGTKNKESSNQIKSVENIGTIDPEVEEENKKVESVGSKADESSKNETKSSAQSPDNLEKEPKTKVSNILDSSDVHPERKGEELICERSSVYSSEVVETEPRREVSSPQHPSNEPAVENPNVSEQPSGENISTVLPSSSSVTDKYSENSPNVVMEPATEVSPVPYALSENKENVIKPVPKPVHEENVSEVKKTSKTDGYTKDTDSDSQSKSPASEKELSEPEETLNFNGKSSRKKLVRGTSQETENPVKENKLDKSPEEDSTPDRVVDKSQLKNVTRKEKSKTKSRKYSEESEEGEMKSGSESESGSSSDSSERKKSRRKSRKGKRKVSRSKSSDSSRSRSRESSSVEKVVKRDKENSKATAGSVSKSHDGSKKSKTKTRKGKCNSREVKKRSRSRTSNSSRNRSRDSSIEKVERTDSEGNSKVDASIQRRSKLETTQIGQHSRVSKRKASRSESSNSSRSPGRRDSEESSKIDASSFSKSHDDSNEQEKSKPKTSDSKRKQNSKKDQRKISRSGSSSSSRSRSRGRSVEKVKKRDSGENLKIEAGSFSKSRDDDEQEKSKPKTSDSKRGRQNSSKDQRNISRSGSFSSSRSRSRGSSVEKVERRDSEENSKIDAVSFSKSHDDNNEQEKSKPETSDSKRGRQDSKKVKRKISRSGSSSSSRSRSRDHSVEKLEKMETEESSKASAGSVSKSHDGAVEKEKAETPQKRLKLKRDNVIVSDLPPQAAKKDTNEDKAPKKERKDSDAGVDEAVEKNNAELTKQIEPEPVKYVSTRKIRISGRKVSEKSEDEPKVKRGKWGSYSSSQKPSKAISISTDSLKNWFPDFKLLKNPDVISEAIEEMQVVSKDENNPDHQTEKIDESKHISQNIEMKDEQISEPVEQIDESEATNILFIQNLVRPFTLLQLKELLKETGNFIEEKFWIDKIKSKCFVTYSTVEEAVKTKTTLNGTRWPSSNPKILTVEFSTEEDLQLHQSGSEPPKPLPPPPPVENPEPLEEHSLEDHRRKERDPQERRRDRSKPQPVREWDKNKLTQESPTRERINRSIERSRSSDKKEKKDSKRRPNEDTPAKLLDDLFQKTKSSPCIYWLPLTEEQVVEREETRRLRRLEREKRIQQREQEEAEHKAKAAQSRNRAREMESRRSSTRSRSPVSRRR